MSVIVVLALIWAAVLIPPVVRTRAERRAEFIDSFREQMGALDSGRAAAHVTASPKRAAGRPKRKVSPQQRRRDILGGLLGAMMGSLVLGAVPSLRMVWVLHLFLLNLFIGYCSLLAHQRRHVRASVMAREAARPAPARATPVERAKRRFAPALDLTR
jgi:predicted lipid-binding transport protein (Tim44 family)